MTVPVPGSTNEMCQISATSAPRPGMVDEIAVEVWSGGSRSRVVERFLGYSRSSATTTTHPFPLPAEHMSITVTITSVRVEQVGLPLKVMAFNIWHGGRLDETDDESAAANVPQLVEFIGHEKPDLLFVVETYGTGHLIEQALNDSQPPERPFRGVQLTRQPDRPNNKDNLWLFSWLPVAEVYPMAVTGVLTTFNFGGARLELPDGTDLHAFSVWLHHLDDPIRPTAQAVLERVPGLQRSTTAEQIVATDHLHRRPMATELLDRLRALVPDESATVILGGDFNTLSHVDWSADYASLPGHGELVLDWPVMKGFEAAGFTDTYRHANPDVARHPGDTRPGRARTYAPSRIDYILTRGERLRVVSSSPRARRLPHHRHGVLNELHPFYSDHAAVVTELVVRGAGAGPAHDPEPTVSANGADRAP